MLSLSNRLWIIALLGIIPSLAMFFFAPIAQDVSYHDFADSLTIAGISNFNNVLSNLAYVIAGVIGLWRCPRLTCQRLKSDYLLFCAGVCLVGFGSAYYHLAPTNETLFWDRLPMTIAFMAMISMLLKERVLLNPPRLLSTILLLIGTASVVYWLGSESIGQGDLRPYILVQFIPMLILPVILLLFPQRYISNRLMYLAFILYFLAKVLEHFDWQLAHLLAGVSGHPLKHLASALAVLCIIYAVPSKESNA